MIFVQDGDYFTVYYTEEYFETLTIRYIGYIPRFYSNRQGIMLPGFFPYFPQAGQHRVFDEEIGSFSPIMLPKDAYFNITVERV